MALSDRDRAILDFERGWWLVPSAKGPAVRERLGLSPTAYYRALQRLLDDPDAVAHDPLVVHRLRRARRLRRQARVLGRTITGNER
ncbi:MAG TPA: DUF3263 domain-containing protein [Acidimicrobiales bacterium]|nr:DUF3263 domain-containing protein [Acidimicrobiales bacterium]